MEATPPTPPPAPRADPDDEPATQGELRTLRRWLIVAGVWAVAATAIGVIALVDARDAKDKASNNASVSGADLRSSEKKLNDRIDKLETEIKALPSSQDVNGLKSDLAGLTKKVNTAQDDAKSATDATTKLEQRVKALEDAQTTGTNTTTSP
jgi:phage shock protein A